MYGDRREESLSQPDSPKRASLPEDEGKARGPGFWVGIAVIIAAIAGLCWYGLPFLGKEQALLREFPALQNSFAALGERTSRAEQDLHRWYGEQHSLQANLGELRKSVDAKFRSSRKEAQEFAETLYRRATVEMESRTGRIDRQLAQVQSAQEADHAQVAVLQSQLTNLRKDAETMTARLSAQDQNDRSEREGLARRLAGLDRRADGAEGDLHRFERSTEPQRIDFELTKHHSQQLAQGISLCVTDTDIARRRVNGWMWIMPDRKAIFLTGQGALQPVVFYSQVDGKRREVVFTNVGKDSAVGYLLLPASAERPATEVARTAPPAR